MSQMAQVESGVKIMSLRDGVGMEGDLRLGEAVRYAVASCDNAGTDLCGVMRRPA